MAIAVDLDGTLAEYHGWVDVTHIGKPIPVMKQRVLDWIKQGEEVYIFTARVSGPDRDEVNTAMYHIQQWLKANGFPNTIPVTCEKLKKFREIWDDRAIKVEHNTGRICDACN